MRLKVPPAAVRTFGVPLVRALARSWRVRTVHEGHWRGVHAAGAPYVFVLWHEVLLPLVWQHRGQGIAMVVSEARDGQYLADLGLALGYRLVRGSSTRGATRALLGAVRVLREGGVAAFTPDGPRGPRREVKPGVVAAAQRAEAVIVPLHAEATAAWRLHSWDRMVIPRPFARVRIIYGEPFRVGPGEAGLADGIARTTAALNQLAGTAS